MFLILRYAATVLFDEVEKAHPRVLTLLLQVMDEGRLTDSKGRTIDFTNTVIIMTSNVGSELLLNITEDDAEAKEAAHKAVMERVQATFLPEFLNRLSAIVMFNALGTSQLEKIVQKAMTGVKRRLNEKGVRVVLESSGARAVLQASYDPSYGARPVERYLEKSVVTTLSRMLISGELTSGTVVHIEAEDSSSLEEGPIGKKAKIPAKLRFRVEKDKAGDTMENTTDGESNLEMMSEGD